MAHSKAAGVAIVFCLCIHALHAQTPAASQLYTIEWEEAYYYNDTAKVKILYTGTSTDTGANFQAKIEVWSNPPIGKERKAAEKTFQISSPETTVDLRLNFDLSDYVLPEEAAAEVEKMNIENEEEREDMIAELLPGGRDGFYEQLYYIKLFIDGELSAESDSAFVAAFPLW
jgi:hypothetical protein